MCPHALSHVNGWEGLGSEPSAGMGVTRGLSTLRWSSGWALGASLLEGLARVPRLLGRGPYGWGLVLETVSSVYSASCVMVVQSVKQSFTRHC